MKYAVIALQGKQFQVSQGDKIIVDRLPHLEEAEFVVDQVLLIADGKDVKIGTPFVEKAQVKLKVLTHQRGEKIRVATYKAKSRSRKVRGHKQLQSRIEVLAIK